MPLGGTQLVSVLVSVTVTVVGSVIVIVVDSVVVVDSVMVVDSVIVVGSVIVVDFVSGVGLRLGTRRLETKQRGGLETSHYRTDKYPGTRVIQDYSIYRRKHRHPPRHPSLNLVGLWGCWVVSRA